VIAPEKSPRVVAIVQARMGSTRLPGKVLRPIAGKPLIWHVVHRLKRCKTLDAIAIATTEDFRDDPIEWFGHEENLEVVRGPEDNVLRRFELAAEKTQADIIVRVSSDAPFLDPAFIDHLVEALIRQDGDYVLVEPGALCAHEGVDPFSRRALDKLAEEAAVVGLDDRLARLVRAQGDAKARRKGVEASSGFRAHRIRRTRSEARASKHAAHRRYAGRSRLHRSAA